MITKSAGALLLLLGSGLVCVERIRRNRRQIALLHDLAAALESIEAAIRWQKLTLPCAIERQCNRELSGAFFQSVIVRLKEEETLHASWSEVFSAIEPPIGAELLSRMELSGDEVRITGELHLTAQQLRQEAEKSAARRAESEKLSVAVCVSAAGLITILLL